MNYLKFNKRFQPFTIVSLGEIRKFDPDFDRRRLTEWQERGLIKKIAKGFYIFSDESISESELFLIANVIYSPSYVSLESALGHYNLVPEGVYTTTSVSSRKTSIFNTPIGRFSYKTIKNNCMFGYTLMECKKRNFKMAEPEKALLDFLYLNPSYDTFGDFFELRLNTEQWKAITSEVKLDAYCAQFQNKALLKRLKTFKDFISHA